MKINEVEALAGITKKNIRFYEEQGLLSPRRNAENGYREYCDGDVQVLRRIRLLRKLDVPIEEIRQMFAGTHTLADGMRRHLITLEREQRNLQHAIGLCQELSMQDIPIDQLDTDALLARMDEMEHAGTAFRDVKQEDIRRRYVAPAIIAAAMVTLLAGLIGLVLWAAGDKDAPPVWIIGIIVGIFAAIGVGVVLALAQRIREIQEREIDDARKY